MRVLLQRVKQASVTVRGDDVSSIGHGLLLLLGVAHTDSERDVQYLADKTASLRIFEDDGGKMNRSLLDIGGAAIVVSQFTLYGDCRKGRRPGFSDAAEPARADQLYQLFAQKLRDTGIPDVQTGIFGEDMLVALQNDGPVTFLLETQEGTPR